VSWNLGEENTNTIAQRRDFTQWFYDNDPYRHLVVIQAHPTANAFPSLLGNLSKLSGLSIYADKPTVFADTLTWRANSAAALRPWVIAVDEQTPANDGILTDANDPNHDGDRADVLLGNIMAGGAGIEAYFGYLQSPSDLNCQDFRPRERWWDLCRFAVDFFRQHQIPIGEMANADALVSGSGPNANHCLALAGQTYVVYLRAGGVPTLDLSGATGSFEVRWYNPRAGGPLVSGPVVTAGAIVSLGAPPQDLTSDWVALVARPTGVGTNATPSASAGSDQRVNLIGSEVVVGLTGTAFDDGLPAPGALSYSWSKVSPASPAVAFADPSALTTTATFAGVGSYTLRLTVTDGELTASDDVVITVIGNTAPVVSAGVDQSVALAGVSVDATLTATASDDGLPAPAALAYTWSTLPPANPAVTFSNPNALSTRATFTAAGVYTLRLTATDGLLSAFDDVVVTVSAGIIRQTSFVPTNDAYLENGVRVNTSNLSIEKTATRTRIVYIKYDLSSLSGTPTAATLTLTEGTDVSSGTMTIRAFAGSNTAWTENTLSTTNAPIKGIPLGVFTGNITDNLTISLDVSAAVRSAGVYSFILECDSSALNVSFASRGTATPARLNVTTISQGGGTNLAPVISAGADKSATLSGASVAVSLTGTASDDGLPAPGSLTYSWTKISPASPAVTFSSPNALSTSATFPATGVYTLRLTVSDGLLTASDDVVVTVSAATSNQTSFVPTNDAYLENGVRVNTSSLSIEKSVPRTRIVYIKYDLSSLSGTPTAATLTLTEGTDVSSGTMTIRAFAGSNTAWTENTLSTTNAPVKGIPLGVFTGNITDNLTISLDVSAAVRSAGVYSFILECDSSALNVSFASRGTATPARLNVTSSTAPAVAVTTGLGGIARTADAPLASASRASTTVSDSLVGSFEALIEDSAGVSSGTATLTISKPGVYSAKLNLGGRLSSAKGANPAPPVIGTVSIPVRFAAPASTSVTFELDGATGIVSGSHGTEALSGFRVLESISLASRGTQSTFVLENDTDEAGHGYGTARLDRRAGILATGRLADGTKFASAGRMSQAGQLIIFVRPGGKLPSFRLGGIVDVLAYGPPEPDLTGRWSPGLQWIRNEAVPVPISGAFSSYQPVTTAAELANQLGLTNRTLYPEPTEVAGSILPTEVRIEDWRHGNKGGIALVDGAGNVLAQVAVGTGGFTGLWDGVLLRDESFGDVVGCGVIQISGSKREPMVLLRRPTAPPR
jgi:hypothetical protein